jgi:hypothetical protein
MTAPTTTDRVSTLVELGELIRSRPGLHAPPKQVAAWYEQKAVVLHHIATETGDPGTEECSRAAHAHAAVLAAVAESVQREQEVSALTVERHRLAAHLSNQGTPSGEVAR